MKTWKTIALSVITTSALVTAGSLAYSWYTQTHQEDLTVTSVETSSSTTEEQSTTYSTEEITTSSTEEITSTEDPYNLLDTYIDSMHKVVEYYNGYYIVDEPAQVGYGTKYFYVVYNPDTGELVNIGSDTIQEQRDWIDNCGN